MNDFFKTKAGKELLIRDIPALINELNELNRNLATANKLKEFEINTKK